MDGSDRNSLLNSQLDYWRARLAGLPEQVELRSTGHGGRDVLPGRHLPVRIDAELHQGLRTLARTRGQPLHGCSRPGWPPCWASWVAVPTYP
ncbi:hypothetical protein GCM10017687_53110 [Streptomyces echinatus]